MASGVWIAALGVARPLISLPRHVSTVSCAVVSYAGQAAVPRAVVLRAPLHAVSASELKVDVFEPTTTADTTMCLMQRLQQLRALSKVEGHALPTEKNSDASLVRWAARQRALHRQGSLPDAMVDDLESVEFVFDVLQHAWAQRYDDLELFFAAKGHSNVPTSHGPLGRWVGRQRSLDRQGKLLAERREALLELSFEFDPNSARWERRLAEYAVGLAEGRRPTEALASWAARQRTARMNGRLSPERIEALNQLGGWKWSSPRARGSAALRRLGRRLAHEAAGAGDANGEMGGEATEAVGIGQQAEGQCYPACASAGRALCVSIGAKREHGAAAELENAREALRSLGYIVVTIQNPSASELTAALIAHAASGDWPRHASSVVAIMGHGVGGQLECQDGEATSLRGCFGLLADAPALQGKPKICLVQGAHASMPHTP